MTKNHAGGIVGRGIIEKESLRQKSWRRNHGGAIIEEETWRRHLGALWEASGMVMEIIWESLRHPAGTQMEPGHSGGSRKSCTQKVMPPSVLLKC